MSHKYPGGNDYDPFTSAFAPPLDETPAEREARIISEKQAKLRSDAIDDEINKQRSAEKKGGKPIKVLLLGQSESGKSTTLKNFQLISSPKAFRAERGLWRAVVQLNVARSIRIILEAMALAQSQNASHNDYASSPMSGLSSYTPTSPLSEPYPILTPDHLKLKMRLGPLLQVEKNLWRRLSPSGAIDFEATQLSPANNVPSIKDYIKAEYSVNSGSGWKGAFGRFLSTNTRDSTDSNLGIDFDDPDDPGVVLYNCADDMIRLWNDPLIRQILERQNLRLQDMPGFFLDSLERVTALKYVPSDDDILRARMKTLGVSEHRFNLKTDNLISRDWRVFDVGGARTLRAAWAPYFDDMDAIIFLAPLSPFDQVLNEDPAVNRLEDSILLWKSIVSNPLLKKTELILFLNKCDILRAKLESGQQFSRWVVSYGDRPNTFDSVSHYMKKKFSTTLRQLSPQPRTFYCHFTSVTDVKSTTHILGNVKDMIIRQSLVESNLV